MVGIVRTHFHCIANSPCKARRRTSARKASGLIRAESAGDAERHLFCFGIGGYTARGLTNTLLQSGWRVSGACRSKPMRDALLEAGVDAHMWNPDDETGLSDLGLQALADATHICSTVPPTADFSKDPVLLCHRSELCEAAAHERLCWVGYLSSTSVYGDHQGDWVNESSKLLPVTPTACARAAAEEAWIQLHATHEVPVHVFRLGGIYGPGRSALDAAQKKMTDPRRQPSASQKRRGTKRYTSRCHVDDICTTLHASMQAPSPGRIYNVIDDDPAPRGIVMGFARSLLDPAAAAPLAGGEPAGLQMGRSPRGGADEKRVRNQRIKEELGVQLAFPNYRVGLQAIVQGDIRPFGRPSWRE
ncbi:hypothetical protein CYMTET_39477 [Cymbomonas tetramitiformis]|uniref:NAD-dependent epimerase/dehydratase domain-containing protein n=1 Tax=Cymbomonas tetramitiformis TaxID=36881 RepID=A0AAE0C9Z7_9CHLO|nr:hypothetical protein CYMTET_39477 [Cymbomonas tetramitiformis]